MPLARIAAALIIFTPLFFRGGRQENGDLVAHEWGTFTSVAGRDGTPVQWAPFWGTPDLPCFVERLSPRNLKLAFGLIRMETPVLYFYSSRALTLSVRVDFPQGWISEWYPKATRVKPELSANSELEPGIGQGQIDWDQIQVSPGDKPELPTSKGESRYFAARNTDSAPLQIGGQAEKFIFYRGVGNFAVPLEPVFMSNDMLEIRNVGQEAIPLAIVFERRGDKLGYRLTRRITGSVNVETPELTGNLVELRKQIADSLVEFGLYKNEALAMIETWHDSWFEEGMRLFYVVPRPMIDSVLPLNIDPAPTATARVFVGRVEVLSPWVRQSIVTALATGDIETLAKFGRFLEPFLDELRATGEDNESPAARKYLQLAYRKMAQEYSSAPCVQ